MANPIHVKILNEGFEVWNAWRNEFLGSKPDLSGADLNRANLTEANLTEANLTGADLFHADLDEANLSKANLRGADLRDVKGFTMEQLTSAVYDDTTKLPQHLIEQSDGEKKK